MKSFIKYWFNACMTQPDVNSRLLAFIHGMVSSFAVLFLCIAFVCAKDKTGYDYMVWAAAGSATGAAVGRWLTKKGGAEDATPPDKSES